MVQGFSFKVTEHYSHYVHVYSQDPKINASDLNMPETIPSSQIMRPSSAGLQSWRLAKPAKFGLNRMAWLAGLS